MTIQLVHHITVIARLGSGDAQKAFTVSTKSEPAQMFLSDYLELMLIYNQYNSEDLGFLNPVKLIIHHVALRQNFLEYLNV
jgi:hypothetical protein